MPPPAEGISVAEADRLLATLLFPPGTERVPLSLAAGRCLAGAVEADRDGPPFDRVAMDGYAVFTAAGRREWTVSGLQVAGNPPLRLGDRASAIEVATGAVLPVGCDAVVPYEHTQRDGADVVLDPAKPLPEPWKNVHRKGSDFHRGDTLFPPGTVLRSTHLHSLASVGIDPVPVVRRLTWALAVTGDELVEVGTEPKPWQIRRSNAAAIVGESAAWGLGPVREASLPDDKDEMRRRLEALVLGLDVLVLTGGVSAGAFDLVPSVLTDLGAVTVFHKVAQRPGKPLWCGRLPGVAGRPGTVVFGLPGNPVSSLFAFRRYVLPWLLAAEGRPVQARRQPVAELSPAALGTTVFLPWSAARGVLDWKGSGDFRALAESDGFIEIDAVPLADPLYYPWGGVC